MGIDCSRQVYTAFCCCMRSWFGTSSSNHRGVVSKCRPRQSLLVFATMGNNTSYLCTLTTVCFVWRITALKQYSLGDEYLLHGTDSCWHIQVCETQNNSIDLPSTAESGRLLVRKSLSIVPLDVCTAIVHGVGACNLTEFLIKKHTLSHLDIYIMLGIGALH